MARLHRSWREMLSYFHTPRLADIRWAHRVNSQDRLDQALAAPDIHFVEGDVALDPQGTPIMAHPPDRSSDLSLATWLDALIAEGRGAKLDIKEPEAVLPSLDLVAQRAQDRIPVMVNADLFQGPGGPMPAFIPEEFVATCQAMVPFAILSPGWAVGTHGQGYTLPMLEEMASLLARVDMPVTLSVHAWLLFSSWTEFKWMLDEHPFTLTVWGQVTVPELVGWLERYTDPQRTLYDIQGPNGVPIFVHGCVSPSVEAPLRPPS